MEKVQRALIRRSLEQAIAAKGPLEAIYIDPEIVTDPQVRLWWEEEAKLLCPDLVVIPDKP